MQNSIKILLCHTVKCEKNLTRNRRGTVADEKVLEFFGSAVPRSINTQKNCEQACELFKNN